MICSILEIMKLRYLLFCLIISIHAERAWICVPVADLIGQRMSSIYSKNVTGCYTSMPHYGKGGWSCPRIGQALFGQEVELVKIKGDEALIGIKNLFYESAGKKRNKYWTLRNNLITEDQLKQTGVSCSKLPAPIDFNPPSMKTHDNTVTLIEPWNNYSVGTRFVRILVSDTKKLYSVWALDPLQLRMKKAQIPKNLCMVYKNPKTADEQRYCFANLLKRWAHRKNGFIPYVWGGFSIRSTCKEDTFILDKKNNSNKEEIRAIRPEMQHEYPKSGLDCSGLVAMAAQCCCLPYYFKNTTTIGAHLKELQKDDSIELGDLIWFRGHVVVISSIAPAMIIESRGYTLKRYMPRCGKVHEIPLKEAFKGINTIELLRNTFFQGKPLQRIDGYGDSKMIYGWNILKLL